MTYDLDIGGGVVRCLLGAWLVAACGDPSASRGAADVGTLAGPDVPLRAVTDEVFTLGGAAASEWDAFTRISDVDFDHGGNLLLMDPAQNRVVVFGPQGEFLRNVSRAGEGPGEFLGIDAMAVLGDGSLVVRDGRKQAFLLFNESGEFIEQFADHATRTVMGQPFPSGDSEFLMLGEKADPSFLLALPDGRLLTRGTPRPQRPNDSGSGGGGTSVRPLETHMLGEVGEVLYDAWGPSPVPGGASSLLPQSATRAFEARLWVDVLRDGRIAVADSVDYRITLVSPGGSVHRTIERPIRPERVTPEIEEAERRRRTEGSGVRVEFVGAIPAEHSAFVEGLREAFVSQLSFADEIPVIAGLAVDSEDRIWVARSRLGEQSTGLIDIVTPEGGYLGTLPGDDVGIPRAFGPEGLMAYVESDEMDVPVVRVIRLRALER